MLNAMRIIDRDLEFYEGEVERLTDVLRRCDPAMEPVHRARLAAAGAVSRALREYDRALRAG